MNHLWWRFYRWRDESILGTVMFNSFGNAVRLWRQDEYYIKLPFMNVWLRTE